MLCGGAEVVIEYLLNWAALIVQSPGTRPEVAIVLRGPQGTGKGTLWRLLGKIVGPHFLHITNARHLVGNFNAHLMGKLFVFVDEGYWAGDKGAEGVLKGLITEPTVMIEMKGREAFMSPNRMAVAMASNNKWVVPAGEDERRYLVIDVPATRTRDHHHWAALNDWIDQGGAGVFLHYLLSRDLSGFNPRAVPHTSALDQQKIWNMPPLDRWLLDALDMETQPGGADWQAGFILACDAALQSFEAYCRRGSLRPGRVDARAIGKRLHEVFACGPAEARIGGVHSRGRGWRLPGLDSAREQAAAAFGLRSYEWGKS